MLPAHCSAALNQRQPVANGQARERSRIELPIAYRFWRTAGGTLARGPYLVVAMLVIGGAIGFLVGGLHGVMWGLASAVLGASLAPAILEPSHVSDGPA